MLSNNVPATFSVEESDLAPVFGQSRLNFNPHSMHSLMTDRVTLLKQLVGNIYKEICRENVY